MRQVILNIHGIGSPKRELEPDEDRYWISTAQFQTAVNLAKESPHDVSFTFDDGNLSDLEIGAPILTQAGLTADFFVLTSRIGTSGSLGETEIKELQAMGHRIGSHGAAHVDWKSLSLTELDAEISVPKARLEAICGRPVVAAGIPFGRYNARVLKAMKAAGFIRAYSSDGGPVRGTPFPIPRTSLTGAMSKDNIAAVIAGHEPIKKTLRRAVSTRLKRVL